MIEIQKIRDQHGEEQTTVNYECPWCGSRGASEGRTIVYGRSEAWIVTACVAIRCGRPLLVRVPLTGAIPWEMLWTSDPGTQNFYATPETYPRPRPSYLESAVPPAIRTDFEEALRCEAAGFKFGAALVGRRVLEAAVRDRGGHGKSLRDMIDSLPDAVLNQPLKDGAHEIRLVGNKAAHAEEVDDDAVAALLDFARDVLQVLYVLPKRLADRRAASKKDARTA